MTETEHLDFQLTLTPNEPADALPEVQRVHDGSACQNSLQAHTWIAVQNVGVLTCYQMRRVKAHAEQHGVQLDLCIVSYRSNPPGNTHLTRDGGYNARYWQVLHSPV